MAITKPANFEKKPFWAPFEYPGMECPNCHKNRYSYMEYCSWCGHNPTNIEMTDCAICGVHISPQEDGVQTDVDANVFCVGCATPTEILITL